MASTAGICGLEMQMLQSKDTLVEGSHGKTTGSESGAEGQTTTRGTSAFNQRKLVVLESQNQNKIHS